MERWGGLFIVGLVASAGLVGACSRCDGSEEPGGSGAAPDAGPPGVPGALTKEQANEVLAKVGDRTITLGEYAAVLDRMNRFERMRYQAADRRKILLDEMINVELLAQEAERRGLDKSDEYQMRVRQILRETALSKVRDSAPKVEEISKSDVRRYYEEHRNEFKEPERRRVAHIVVKSKEEAERLLGEAQQLDAAGWGRLVRTHSLDGKKWASDAPDELVGDLGIVSANDAEDASDVPQELRRAVFQVKEIGGIHPTVVRAGSRFHIVRMIGKTAERIRSFAEAERSIRVAVARQKLREAEAQFEQELRERFPVEIDAKALEQVRIPKPSHSAGSAEP